MDKQYNVDYEDDVLASMMGEDEVFEDEEHWTKRKKRKTQKSRRRLDDLLEEQRLKQEFDDYSDFYYSTKEIDDF